MKIKQWYKRNFCVLLPAFNGDTINTLNCRSLWKDEKGRLYRCKSLIDVTF